MNKKVKNILIIVELILIIFLSVVVYFLYQKNNAAPGNSFTSTNYKSIDIREDDLTELLKFSLENNIDLTVPVSEKSLNADVVSFFSANGQNIFGPCSNI